MSLPVYIYYINENFFFNIFSFFILIAGFWYLFHKKISFFWFGFFTGILWFWWIGLSFRYYNLTCLIPFIVLFIGIGYGTIFWVWEKFLRFLSSFLDKYFKLDWFNFLLILSIVYGLDCLRPFTFDWLKFEVLFLTFLPSLAKWQFLLFLTGIWLAKKNRLFLLLTLSVFIQHHPKSNQNENILLISTHVPQNRKWQKSYISVEIQNNFSYIQNAIKDKYKTVVLPESAFPLFLNLHPEILNRLKQLSQKITIITGALHYKNRKLYNSTYIFEKGKVQILDKHVLVPFGEYIPLPFFQKEINRLFFGNASDYSTSENFGIYTLNGKKFINAICYEITDEALYRLKPKNIIAITNDAWFMPSTEPVIQKLLIKYYASKYKKNVYHSINGYKSYTIRYGK